MTFREGEQAYIIENNSHVTPVEIVKRNGNFYTIQLLNHSRIGLRESRLFHIREEAEKRIRGLPLLKKEEMKNRFSSPYQYDNHRSPYGI